jgi:hypothetical protein
MCFWVPFATQTIQRYLFPRTTQLANYYRGPSIRDTQATAQGISFNASVSEVDLNSNGKLLNESSSVPSIILLMHSLKISERWSQLWIVVNGFK